MSDSKRETYRKRVRATSREQVILEEMKKAGYWPENGDSPTLPEALILEESKLRKELQEISKQYKGDITEEELLQKIRTKRLKESREKKKELRGQREKDKLERQRLRKEQLSKDIDYLGTNVSTDLNDKISNQEKLTSYNLPVLHSVWDLSKEMDISVETIRFLSFSRRTSSISHYQRFYLPKKNGDKRLISAPKPKLKKVQHWILENMLNKLNASEQAHGFLQGKSIVSNAKPHVGKSVVINMDLKNFFPSISYPRVKGIFKSIGYSSQLATVLALICTEPNEKQIKVENKILFVSQGDRFLPQGAPTSPMLTNILCRQLDKRLFHASKKYNLDYSRYADDLTFSANYISNEDIKKFFSLAKVIIKDENLALNFAKTRVMRSGNRQEVTGIVVNNKVSLERKKLKKFRALLHQIELTGLENKTWDSKGDLLQSIKGYANYVAMVKPVQGNKFRAQIKLIEGKFGPNQKKWWQFWKKK